MILHQSGTDDCGELIVTQTRGIVCVFDKPYPRKPVIVLAPGDRATYELKDHYLLYAVTEAGFKVLFYDLKQTYRLRYFVETVEEKEVRQPNHYKKKQKQKKGNRKNAGTRTRI